MNTNKINLEFSEEQQCFHFNHFADEKGDWDNTTNTNGYFSIGTADDKTLYKFLKFADKKFATHKTLANIKTLWSDFKQTASISPALTK